jgi:hypothetical protein
MNARQVGLLMRMTGLMMEIASVVAFLRFRGREARVIGLSVDTLCYIGLGLGLVLWIAGMGLFYRPRARPKPSRFGLSLGGDDENASKDRRGEN